MVQFAKIALLFRSWSSMNLLVVVNHDVISMTCHFATITNLQEERKSKKKNFNLSEIWSFLTITHLQIARSRSFCKCQNSNSTCLHDWKYLILNFSWLMRLMIYFRDKKKQQQSTNFVIGRDSNQKPFPISRHFCQPMRWQSFYSWRQLMIEARALWLCLPGAGR